VETWVPAGLDPYTQRERQRGFVFTGQQRLIDVEGEETDCYGSEFSIYDIQELMLVPRFQLSPEELAQARETNPAFGLLPNGENVDVRQFLPSQGLVLVEIWWQHDLLLDLPVYNPIFNALGDDQTTLYVWAAFPAPAVEPRIQYFLSND
jgi:hypothetical protein